MPSTGDDNLRDLLVGTSDYIHFSDAIRRSLSQDRQSAAHILLKEARLRTGMEQAKDPNILVLQKAVLGLGAIAAFEDNDESQWSAVERTLMALMNENPSRYARDIIASELTYLDQYLRTSVRQKVCQDLRKRNLQAVTPSISDYFRAWKLTDNINGLLEISAPTQTRMFGGNIHAYFVCSTKGGVGKSLAALSLTHQLSLRANANERVALVDLDVFGPTLQFSLNVPAVSNTHSVLPYYSSGPQQSEWRYWSLLDLLWGAAREAPTGQLRTIGRSCILPVSNLQWTSTVLVPDSPTYAAIAASYWDTEVGRNSVLTALSVLLGELGNTGHKHVVLDCRPGLFGANGFLLQWMSQSIDTRLLVMSSPSAADVGTTLYEALWIAAAGPFRWSSKPVFAVNMWPQDKDVLKTMDEWVRQHVPSAILRAMTGVESGTTSASQIYSSRMWSYLYWRTLRDCAPLRIRSLREDTDLRHITDPPCKGQFSFPWDVLCTSKWHKEDMVHVFSDLDTTTLMGEGHL